MMKILHINRSDTVGGAARAATRLLEGTCHQGHEVKLFVQQKSTNRDDTEALSTFFGHTTARARRALESLLVMLTSGKTRGMFAPAFVPDKLSLSAATFSPDIIHLHWVARMMRLENIGRLNVPVVWTLHDSWPFTGGCFLPPDCNRYQESCGRCPVLGSSRENDLSRRVWERKMRAWQDLDLTLVAPSRWMRDCARASSLFGDKRVEVIPNGLDVKQFAPIDKQAARENLSLPRDKRLILYGAKSATEDRNKGFYLLSDALRRIGISPGHSDIELVVFGSEPSENLHECNLKTHIFGWQENERALVELYAASDLFVFPSLQESLGYTAMEAMACGTPCVAFNQGGVPDLIDHKVCGYLAEPYEPEDLARGILWILENQDRYKSIVAQSRKKIEREFAVELVAERHMSLYSELLQQSKN